MHELGYNPIKRGNRAAERRSKSTRRPKKKKRNDDDDGGDACKNGSNPARVEV